MTEVTEWTRLARYFAGETDAGEAEAIESWIAADPDRARQVEELRALWEAAAAADTSWDTPGSWQRLQARSRARQDRPRVGLVHAGLPASGYGRRWTAWRIGAMAAGLAAVLGAGLYWRSVLPARDATTASAAPLREVRAEAGRRAAFTLADGSRVVLAPGSVLRYDAVRFGVSTRELQLEGRAFFEVRHDARRPFLVHTPHTVTEDLGTEFVVSDYPDDPAPEVVVASGTVAVRVPMPGAVPPTTVLTRGEMVRLDAAGRSTVHRNVDLDLHLAWTDGRLVFANARVSEVVAELGRWYGSDLQVRDSALAAQRFTATYTAQSESTVVRELATAIGARIERRGRTTILLSAKDRP